MVLENILSSMNLRQLSLIRFLIKNGPTPTDIILEKLEQNKSTLLRDIHQLNELIEPVQLFLTDSVTLDIPTNFNNRYIFSCILSKSSEFNLIEELFFNENHSILTLSNKLFMSESSIKRIIKKSNSVLKEYDICINSYPIKLVGNEQNICNLIIRIFEEKYTNHTYPFDKNQQYALQELLLHNLKKDSLNLNYPDIERVKLIVLVIMKRMQHGHFQETDHSELPDMHWSVFNNLLYKKIFKSVFHIELSKKNISYLFAPFFRTQFAVNIDHLTQLRKDSPSVDQRVRKFKTLIQNISKHYSIEIENEESLVFHVYNTNELTISFSHILYSKSKEFIEKLTLYNEEFSLYIQKELVKLDLSPSCQNYNSYALPYVLVSHWKNLAFQLQKNKDPIKVLLFFDSDIEHMEFIKELLSERFNHKLDIQIADVLVFKELKKRVKKYDLLITNIPGIELESIEIICMSMYPNSLDFYNINQFYRSFQLMIN